MEERKNKSEHWQKGMANEVVTNTTPSEMTDRPAQKNALSVGGLVCGIVGVVMALIPVINFFFGTVLGIVAVVLGGVARKQDGSGLAAIVLGSVTLALVVLAVILVFILLVIGSVTGDELY